MHDRQRTGPRALWSRLRRSSRRIAAAIAGVRPRGAFAGPAGAAILIVCFFLPWMRCSCGPGLGRTLSGVELGGIAWLAVAAGCGVLAAFAILGRLKLLRRAWPVPAAAAVLAGGAIASGMARLSRGIDAGLTHVKPVGLHVRLQAGGIGMIAGLALLLLGTVLLMPRRQLRRGSAGATGRVTVTH